MPIKFDKELSSHLFKFVRTVEIKYNPFDGRSRSVRELWRQLQAPRYIQANPKLKISLDIHNRADQPTARFLFMDESEALFQGKESNVNEILLHVHLKATKIDAEFEMDGKNIDEML